MSRRGKHHADPHPETIYPTQEEELLRKECRNEGQFLWRVKLLREKK